ncbi:MAG: VOC family protein [Ramlibacter sp.]
MTGSPPQLRLARPCSDLARAERMYVAGLGWQVLGRFEDHEGFDGVMLGTPGGAWHLEFTRSRLHAVRPSPTPEDLLVLYMPSAGEWRTRCEAMAAAGFCAVRSLNPYWDRQGRSFEDPDGYRVVLQQAAWPAPARRG